MNNQKLGNIILNSAQLSTQHNEYKTKLETEAVIYLPLRISNPVENKKGTSPININNVTATSLPFPYLNSTDQIESCLFSGSASQYFDMANLINEIKISDPEDATKEIFSDVTTFSFFVKFNTGSAYNNHIFSCGNNDTTKIEIFTHGPETNNYLYVIILDETNTEIFGAKTKVRLAADTWGHYILQIGESGILFYKDGILLTPDESNTELILYTGSYDLTYNLQNIDPDRMFLGCDINASGNPSFSTSSRHISNFYMFNRVLNVIEIKALYNSQFKTHYDYGSKNIFNSDLEFKNINMNKALNYEPYNKDKIKMILKSIKYTNGTSVETGSNIIDIYINGLDSLQYDSTGEQVTDYLYTTSIYNSFQFPFYKNSEYLNCEYITNYKNSYTINIKYMNETKQQMPLNDFSVYPNFVMNIEIYSI